MFITFNGNMFPLAPGADNVYPFKLLSPFNIPDFFPPRGSGVFAPQTGVYTAFIDINAPFARDSL